MEKTLNFIKENNQWYIDLPNWIGPKSALLMVGGAHKILNEFSNGNNVLKIKVSTDNIISSNTLIRQNYTITGGAYYNYREEKDVWLCPVTLFVFGKYPKYITFDII